MVEKRYNYKGSRREKKERKREESEKERGKREREERKRESQRGKRGKKEREKKEGRKLRDTAGKLCFLSPIFVPSLSHSSDGLSTRRCYAAVVERETRRETKGEKGKETKTRRNREKENDCWKEKENLNWVTVIRLCIDSRVSERASATYQFHFHSKDTKQKKRKFHSKQKKTPRTLN